MKRPLIPTAILLATMMLGTAVAAQQPPIQVRAAGSLQEVEPDLVRAFAAVEPSRVQITFGPSGLLRQKIENGDPADILVSADMAQPEALVSSGWAAFTVPFAKNELCVFGRPGLNVTGSSLVERMRDPSLKLATSTPGSDPSGDYTWEMFHKADQLLPGSFAILDATALKLIGGANAIEVPKGRNLVDYVFTSGRADMFVAYCSGGASAKAADRDIAVVPLPAALRVGATYGLAVRKGAPAAAYAFALFHLARPGRDALTKAGFVD